MTGEDDPIGEDELQAFVDERLDGPRRMAVEAHLARHPERRERIAAERRQRASLRAQLQGKAAEPIPARLRIATIQAARRARLARPSSTTCSHRTRAAACPSSVSPARAARR